MAHVDNSLFSSVQDQTVVEKSFAHVGGPDQFSQNKQPKGRGVINQRRLQDQMFAYVRIFSLLPCGRLSALSMTSTQFPTSTDRHEPNYQRCNRARPSDCHAVVR